MEMLVINVGYNFFSEITLGVKSHSENLKKNDQSSMFIFKFQGLDTALLADDPGLQSRNQLLCSKVQFFLKFKGTPIPQSWEMSNLLNRGNFSDIILPQEKCAN